MSVEMNACMVQPKQNNTLKNAAIVAGVGAGVSAASNYATQKYVIKNADKIKDSFKLAREGAKGMEKGGFVRNNLAKSIRETKNILKTGKVDWSNIAKKAGKTGLVVAGIYLGYKAITGLFSK